MKLTDESHTSTGHTITDLESCEIAQEILLNPQLLVGQRIRQRFNEGGQLVWYDGTVLHMSSSETNEYEVKYDEDDDVYCFPLLDDFKNGDLQIVAH